MQSKGRRLARASVPVILFVCCRHSLCSGCGSESAALFRVSSSVAARGDLCTLPVKRASFPASRMTARSIIHMHFWRQVLHPSQCGIVREQLHSRGHDSRSPPLPSRESVLQRPNCASATLVPGTPGERRRCVLSSSRVCTFPFRCAVLPNWEFRCAFLPFFFFFRPLLRFDVK